MPVTREEHVSYTRNELNTYPYYVQIMGVLTKNNIKSYLDIGANVGEFCNYLFEHLTTLEKAYLIEPEDGNFKFMLANIKNVDKVVPYNCAISYDSDVSLQPHYTGNVGGFLLVKNTGEPNVVLKTLEEIDLPLVDLVKIDVEGHEYNIIENSNYLQKIKWIEIEFHDANKPLKSYVETNFPNHEIVVVEDVNGRCLLKLKNYE